MVERGSIEEVSDHWLLLTYGPNPTIRLDCTALDRVLALEECLILSIGELTVDLTIVGGPTCAREFAERLSVYTRSAPITTQAAYDRHRAFLVAATNSISTVDPFLWFGADVVQSHGDWLYIGNIAIDLDQVRQYARVAAPLPLPQGKIQAAITLLPVAANYRSDDPRQLAARIADYESRVTRNG